MKRALIWLASVAVFGAEANAAPQRGPSLTLAQPASQAHRSVSFRLVQDREFDPYPVYHSGIIAQTQVAPNATVGFGLLKSRPKKPSGEWTLDGGAPRSRKAALNFLLKF